MNITVEASTNDTFNRLKARYIAAVCGIALIAAISATTTPWQGDSKHSPPNATFSASGYSKPAVIQKMTFVLVDSEAELTRLEALFSTDSHNWDGSYLARVTLVTTPEQEASLVATLEEMRLAGKTLHVTDLRTSPSGIITVAARSGASNALLDAAIIRSVISTEHGAWPFDAISE